jgi:hypothetical protein
MHRIGCCFHGEIELRSVFRIARLFLLSGLTVTAGSARLTFRGGPGKYRLLR